MTDAGKGQNKGHFKKRAHRPWKSSLLEQTIEETTMELKGGLFDLDIDLDIDLELSEDLDHSYPEFGFTEEIIKAAIPKTEVKNEFTVIATEIADDSKINDKILLGGFFKTKQRINQNDLENTRKINALLTDLKIREQNIEANETRMRQVIEQAAIVTQQFNAAVEQANKASSAQQTETNLRKQAETQIKEIQLHINNIQIELQNERLLRLAAETNAQQTLATNAESHDLKQQLQNVIDKLMHTELEKNSVEHHLFELQERYTQLELDKNSTQQELSDLEDKYLEQDLEKTAAKNMLSELENRYMELGLEKTAATNELSELKDKYMELDLEKTAAKHMLIELEDKYMELDLEKTAATNELSELKDKYAKMNLEKKSTEHELSNLQNKYTEIHKAFAIVDLKHSQCAQRINDLADPARVKEFEIQRDKLKAIIDAERKLRKIAESQLQEAMRNLNGKKEPEITVEDTKQAKVINYDYEPDDLNY